MQQRLRPQPTGLASQTASACPQASHLLKYDSTLGTFNAQVKIVDDNTLSVDGKNIRIVSSRDPLQLPWKEMGIDIVIEGTGVFVDRKGAGKHLEVGPPRRSRPPACWVVLTVRPQTAHLKQSRCSVTLDIFTPPELLWTAAETIS